MITCLAHVPQVLFHELITTVVPLACALLNISLVKVVPFPNEIELKLKNNNKVIIIFFIDQILHSLMLL